ncbi:MAG: glycosyltransferase family 4 protein [Magnetococcus sp. WYHC-3]
MQDLYQWSITTQRVTGVQRYAREVIRAFDQDTSFNPCVLVPPGESPVPFSLDRINISRVGRRRGQIWEQWDLLRQSRDGLLFSPGNIGPLWHPRQVVTIHDASTLDHPEWFSRPFALWYRTILPRLMRRAVLVLTDSDYSRQRLLAHVPVDPNKVVSIPLGVGKEFRPMDRASQEAFRRKHDLPQSYLLTVGSLDPRKNLLGLVAAWERVSADLPQTHLLVAGGGGDAFTRLELDMNRWQRLRIRLLGYVPQENLPGLYASAAGFLYPSYYEGFGFPVLEAMASGTPVLTSNVTSLPEVAGDAALMIDPHVPRTLEEGIVRLATDSALCEGLVVRGMDQARRFDWDITARKTRDLLHQVAG